MVVVYEGNRGSGLIGEPNVFDLMTGCEYGFKVKFVRDNIQEHYSVYEEVWEWWHKVWRPVSYTLSDMPSTQYCPSQNELKSQGYGNNTYFYISSKERYHVRTLESGNKETYYITYEEYTSNTVGNGRWASRWKDKDGYKIWFSYSKDDKEWQYSTMRFGN